MKDFDYNIIINRKNIKNLYIRIDDDGNVIVNANRRISDNEINEILSKKDSWIRSHVSKIKERKELDRLDGKIISILGKKYKIKVVKNNQYNVYVMGEYVILEVADDNIGKHIKAINDFLRKKFISIIYEQIYDECKLIADSVNISTDFDLTVKLMKSRFGSYSSRTHRICLNYCLVKYDEDIIKSVFLHEIAHIKHMNHGKGFYKLLYRMCPDYDVYNRYLKKSFTYSDTWFID